MGCSFAKVLFSEPVKKFQQQHGSRATYQRMTDAGVGEQPFGPEEIEFIQSRDSFYFATVTPDGWPYIQHRGGPIGFLSVTGGRSLAFADYAGNKQYITAGNLSATDRFAMFMMDYPSQTRLKIVGHARMIEPGEDPRIEALLIPQPNARIERIFVLNAEGFDWNCSQHITPRYTREELEAAMVN
ncbi:pyridoxamine 5'-phosphate oxidase family protein [Acidobacteria bacterium AB60]|nr:pyridoxamine 5'-phosphate oxidase family protein [Acidobacteria bacterium AB60]